MLELPVLNKTLPLLSLLLLAGCSSTPSQPISAQTYFRGLVRIADNQLQYRSCDQANWRSEIQGVASIRERLLDRLLSAPLGVGIYLEAWGDAQGRLTELQMLGGRHSHLPFQFRWHRVAGRRTQSGLVCRSAGWGLGGA